MSNIVLQITEKAAVSSSSSLSSTTYAGKSISIPSSSEPQRAPYIQTMEDVVDLAKEKLTKAQQPAQDFYRVEIDIFEVQAQIANYDFISEQIKASMEAAKTFSFSDITAIEFLKQQLEISEIAKKELQIELVALKDKRKALRKDILQKGVVTAPLFEKRKRKRLDKVPKRILKKGEPRAEAIFADTEKKKRELPWFTLTLSEIKSIKAMMTTSGLKGVKEERGIETLLGDLKNAYMNNVVRNKGTDEQEIFSWNQLLLLRVADFNDLPHPEFLLDDSFEKYLKLDQAVKGIGILTDAIKAGKKKYAPPSLPNQKDKMIANAKAELKKQVLANKAKIGRAQQVKKIEKEKEKYSGDNFFLSLQLIRRLTNVHRFGDRFPDIKNLASHLNAAYIRENVVNTKGEKVALTFADLLDNTSQVKKNLSIGLQETVKFDKKLFPIADYLKVDTSKMPENLQKHIENLKKALDGNKVNDKKLEKASNNEEVDVVENTPMDLNEDLLINGITCEEPRSPIFEEPTSPIDDDFIFGFDASDDGLPLEFNYNNIS